MVGDDGLKLADFPDLKIENEIDGAGNAGGGTVSYLNTPAQVMCRRAISKAGHTYFVEDERPLRAVLVKFPLQPLQVVRD